MLLLKVSGGVQTIKDVKTCLAITHLFQMSTTAAMTDLGHFWNRHMNLDSSPTSDDASGSHLVGVAQDDLPDACAGHAQCCIPPLQPWQIQVSIPLQAQAYL